MYKVIGVDNQVYGPVDAQQIRQWIQERRLSTQSQLQLEGEEQFRALATFPEFADLAMTPASAPPVPSVAVVNALPPSNRMATTGFVLGLLALICCGAVTGLPGVICSAIGLSQISSNPPQRGRPLAIAGIVLSILGIIETAGIFAFRDFFRNFTP